MKKPNNISSPPKLPLRLIRSVIKEAYLEEIEGDLEEKYWDNLKQFSKKKADRLYGWDSLKLLRPTLMKKMSGDYQLNNYGMLKNYFVTAMRSLMRNTAFSAINIIGLAIGFTTFGLISFYVFNELSFDKYHKNADRIFRIVENLRTENEILYQSTSSPPMGPHFLKDFPEVESYVRFQRWRLLGQRDGVSSYEPDSYIADSTVFDVFSFNLLQGDKKTALREPFSIVLTKSMAIKYFGDEDPLGKSIKMDDDNYKVTGVMDDIPENSHFRFSNLISFSTWSRNNKRAEDDAWFWNGFHTYLLLRNADDAKKISEKMGDFLTRSVEKGGMYYEDLPLQPLRSIYMAKPRSWENGARGSINNVYILSIIALFILLTACFNYVNLATARASRRLKEVGLRKSLGAIRRMLVTQFLGESLVVTFLASLLAIVLTWFALPLFRVLVESPLSTSILPNPWLLTGIMLALILAVGILAGAYPAFIVSGFNPVNTFRKSTKGMAGHQSIRKILVGIQFVISITLVAGTMLVYDQLNAVRSQNLGFDKEGVLVVPTNGDSTIVNHLSAVKNELKGISGVSHVAGSSSTPGQSINNLFTRIEMTDGKMSPTNINYNFVDHDFLTTYQIELIAGRDFQHEVSADTAAYLINETAVKDFGWTPEEAIGKKVNRRYDGKIIGVMKDFHYKSLHTEIEPLLINLTSHVDLISIRIEGENVSSTVEKVASKWEELVPHLPFDYSFLDVEFDNQYKADHKLGKVAGIFTGLAIFIGCLGLLGLMSFVVERRTKEIGIRKVLGASVSSVVMLITNEFLWLMIIALAVATPITWYLISEWGQNFTLQAEINPLRFVLAGFAVFLVAWVSISFLSFRAASSNPAKALRSE